MSALGQKQTFAMQNVMSALHPKADMCSAQADVRFVPKADIVIQLPHRRANNSFALNVSRLSDT
jgi:hypothetical protein